MVRNTKKSQSPERKIANSRKILIGLMILAVAANLYISNSLVSKKFALQRKRDDLFKMSTALAIQETALKHSQNLANLLSLAQRSGMIAGRDGEALTISAAGVALSNAHE